MPGSAGDEAEAIVTAESIESVAPLEDAVTELQAENLDPAEQETSKADDVDHYADEDSRMNWLRWVTTLGLQSCDNRAVDALLKDEASVEAFYNFLAAGEGQEGENRCAVFYLEDATSDFGINSAPPPEQSAASESLEGEAVDDNAAPAASVEDAANPNEASSSNAPAEVQQSEAASADAEPGAESETAAGANSNEGGESAIPESDATVDPEPAADQMGLQARPSYS